MAKPRKTRSEKLLEMVEALKSKFAFFKCKETAAFAKIITDHSKEIDSYTSNSFIEMAKKRAAFKYYGMSEEKFNEQIREMVAVQKAAFQRAKSLTVDDVASIEDMNEKAKAAREAAKKSDLEDLLQ